MLVVTEIDLLDVASALKAVVLSRVDAEEHELIRQAPLVTLEWASPCKRRVNNVKLLVAPVVELNEAIRCADRKLRSVVHGVEAGANVSTCRASGEVEVEGERIPVPQVRPVVLLLGLLTIEHVLLALHAGKGVHGVDQTAVRDDAFLTEPHTQLHCRGLVSQDDVADAVRLSSIHALDDAIGNASVLHVSAKLCMRASVLAVLKRSFKLRVGGRQDCPPRTVEETIRQVV